MYEHDDLRGAVILAGRTIRKLTVGHRDKKTAGRCAVEQLLAILRRTLRDAREARRGRKLLRRQPRSIE